MYRVILAVITMGGFAVCAVVTFADCETKCDNVRYFTKDSEPPTPPVRARRFVVVEPEDNFTTPSSCRRIWRTRDPENDIASSAELQMAYRRLLNYSCLEEDTCFHTGGVYGKLVCTGHAIDTTVLPAPITCFEMCVPDDDT